VMITANDYELKLYNGDQGILCCRTTSNPLLKRFAPDDYILFGKRKISPWALTAFTLSYCVSVHKSQGSEYNQVVILAPPGSESFGREVLYTAVTRAKKNVIVASTQDLIFKAIASSSRKRSGLINHKGRF
jgi:exodeoxyribonuclease V alpha subunit